MKTILLLSVLFCLNAFAHQWTNPYACSPDGTKDCWITCFNADAVNGSDRMVRVYITPMKNGRAEFLVQKENLFFRMKPSESGHVIRNDNDPFNIELKMGRSRLDASVDEDTILINNGWILSGRSKVAAKSRNMICRYSTKTSLIGYDSIYTPGFPEALFNKHYAEND